MIANKRMREDLEEKEADYQKLVIIYKDTLKKKRAMQKQYKQVLNQNKELHNKELNKDAKYSLLQKRAQVMHDMTSLAKVSKSL